MICQVGFQPLRTSDLLAEGLQRSCLKKNPVIWMATLHCSASAAAPALLNHSGHDSASDLQEGTQRERSLYFQAKGLGQCWKMLLEAAFMWWVRQDKSRAERSKCPHFYFHFFRSKLAYGFGSSFGTLCLRPKKPPSSALRCRRVMKCFSDVGQRRVFLGCRTVGSVINRWNSFKFKWLLMSSPLQCFT